MIYLQENVTVTATYLCVNLKLCMHTYIHTHTEEEGERQTDRQIVSHWLLHNKEKR